MSPRAPFTARGVRGAGGTDLAGAGLTTGGGATLSPVASDPRRPAEATDGGGFLAAAWAPGAARISRAKSAVVGRMRAVVAGFALRPR